MASSFDSGQFPMKLAALATQLQFSIHLVGGSGHWLLLRLLEEGSARSAVRGLRTSGGVKGVVAEELFLEVA